jgi:hypothetical protein
MLIPAPADRGLVIHRLLVLISLVCCGLVAVSFLLFARDQMAGASQHQRDEIVSSAPLRTAPPISVPRSPGQPRRFIDSASRTLTSPFSSIVSSDSQWVDRGVPTIIAMLVYGVGLGYLARYSRGMS